MKKTMSHKIAVSILCLHIIAFLAWLELFKKHDWLLILGSDLFQTSAPLISALWLFNRYRKENGRNRNFWLLLCFSMLSYTIAMLIWMFYEIYLRVTPPFPGIQDLFWILTPIIGLLAFNELILKTNTSKVFQHIYDALIVISVTTSISWEFIIKPILEQSADHGILYKIVYAGYPISELALFFGLISIFNSRNIKLASKFFFLIIVGQFCFIVADTVYLFLVSQNMYSSSNPIAVLWNLGLLLIGISSYYSNENIVEIQMNINKHKTNYLREVRLWLPYLSVFILFLITIYDEKKINSLVVGSSISIFLIIFRQIFTRVHNEVLVGKLKELNIELDEQVQLRTKELVEKNEQLEESISNVEYLAYHDLLSGLSNRRYFEKQLSGALNEAKAKNEEMAILFLDLDRFKVINDTLNHSIGDILLQHVAKRLKACIDDKGIICRQGGDEFIILLPEGDRTKVILMVEKIVESLNNIFLIEGHELFITTSIGISFFPDHGEEVGVLIRRADVAMYSVKNEGKNNYKIFTPDMKDSFNRRLTIENGLRKATEQDEFLIYYQPKLELKTNKIVGMEALIRWNHPEMGMVPPDDFISIAEETGLINKIGAWVLQMACWQTKLWQEEGLKDLSVSVNVSAIQFMQKDLYQQVNEALTVTELDPKYLELEVTESIMQNVQHASFVLERLKQLGVKISLDDFGSGYSSLTQIRHLPFDTLKIDKTFIDDIVTSLKDQAIVKTIIELGKNLGLTVVAEGVEDVEQLEYLRENGCDRIQGYIIGRPLPKQEFESKIRQNIIYK
ncbi:DUF4084 domain-containing protein [Neobacillus sp. PS3-40]|uniref:DUF4084 domain-containing protein n=1 Tax=Neobacillus sp. PS3-40 TaxID=3070679 RepID=UPI0027E16625|nr:DUF4084 domain-containing protein [Neobacillus sp. PS3-40]WML46336.1 DUF4084 domain-containing protein [Neobacillus sp. PS3-40]